VEENKWLAQRYGIHGELADFGALTRKPFAELIDELIGLVGNEAERLGCLAEVEKVREILQRGTSADRQLQVHEEAHAAGASEQEAAAAVVDWLIGETAA
jgi:carboxylate-amine ligase